MMTARFGSPKITLPFAIFMNSGSLQETGCASVICWHTPFRSKPVPSVMMKGSVLWCTTRKPLT